MKLEILLIVVLVIAIIVNLPIAMAIDAVFTAIMVFGAVWLFSKFGWIK